MDRQRLAESSREVQTIKVADLIDNTPSIVQHDPDFARVYLREKRDLLNVLTLADQDLVDRAWTLLREAEGGYRRTKSKPPAALTQRAVRTNNTTNKQAPHGDSGQMNATDNSKESQQLISLEEHNRLMSDKYRKANDPRPCPNCGKQLLDSAPQVRLMSSPPKAQVYCDACGFRGTRIA